MNKQLKRYFDYKFEGTVLDTRPYGDDEDGGEEWFGIWKDDLLTLGHPDDEIDNIWYSNGPYFEGGVNMFDMSIGKFFREMADYLTEKYEYEFEFSKIY